jgi:Domain of unknown function (DUF1707)
VSALLVSDQEREDTVGLLRRHWLTGRLTAEEFEERVAEVWRARYSHDLWQALRFLPVDPPPAGRESRGGSGTAVASLVIGAMALCLMLVTFGLAFPLVLWMAATAWMLGRGARRSGAASSGGVARAGELMGIIGTAWSVLMLAGCAALIL